MQNETRDGALVVSATLTVHPDTHLDHGLTTAHIAWLLREFASLDGFAIRTFTFPDELPEIDCALYGPVMGDAALDESVAIYVARGNRKYISRLVRRPMRPTRTATLVAGPHDGKPCVLFTVYGGPLAPREPGDPSLQTSTEVEESRAFWAQHALSLDVAPEAERLLLLQPPQPILLCQDCPRKENFKF